MDIVATMLSGIGSFFAYLKTHTIFGLPDILVAAIVVAIIAIIVRLIKPTSQ